MITMITGNPGTGKTTLLVELLMKLYPNRPIFSDNVNGLALEHQELDILDWPAAVPDGALIIADEVQRKWRTAGPGSAPHPSIVALETHRHRGMDLIIVTQKPALVHKNVRELVGRHIHLRDTWSGRWMYEWAECEPTLPWKKCDNKRKYRMSKAAQKHFVSASVHVQPIRNRPILLYVIAAAVIALCYFLWSIYDGFSSQRSALDPSQLVEQIPSITPASVLSGMAATAIPANEKPKIDDRVDWVPRLSHMPETAPAFDAIREVRQMPIVAGGVCFQGECKCFTQQGTNAGLSHDDCLTAINNPRFDPYSQPQAVQAQHSPTLSRNQSPENIPSEVRTAVALTSHQAQLEVTQAAKTSRLLATGGL